MNKLVEVVGLEGRIAITCELPLTDVQLRARVISIYLDDKGVAELISTCFNDRELWDIIGKYRMAELVRLNERVYPILVREEPKLKPYLDLPKKPIDPFYEIVEDYVYLMNVLDRLESALELLDPRSNLRLIHRTKRRCVPDEESRDFALELRAAAERYITRIPNHLDFLGKVGRIFQKTSVSTGSSIQELVSSEEVIAQVLREVFPTRVKAETYLENQLDAERGFVYVDDAFTRVMETSQVRFLRRPIPTDKQLVKIQNAIRTYQSSLFDLAYSC